MPRAVKAALVACLLLPLCLSLAAPALARPPYLIINKPENGALIQGDEVVIEGRVDDIEAGGLTVDNKTVNFDWNGLFTARVSLRKGENTITATAKNSEGSVSQTVRVTTDYTPRITVDSPANNEACRNNYVMVSGRVDNTRDDGLTVNNERVGLNGNNFSYRFNLKPGKNTLTIKAENKLESVSTSLSVTFAPTVTTGSEYELVVPAKGVKASAFNDALQVEVPAGAVAPEAKLVLYVADNASLAPPPAWRSPVSRAFSLLGASLEAPVTLTFKLNTEMLPASLSRLAVCRYDERDYAWQPLGGQVDGAKNSVSLAVARQGTYMVMVYYGTLDDIVGIPEQEAIEVLLARGIASGMTPTLFMPYETMTRGQLAAFLVKALGLPIPAFGASPFADTPADHWAAPFALAAAQAGVMRGTGALTFSPDEPVSRAETAVALARAAGLQPLDEQQAASALRSFADRHDLPPYAVGHMAALVRANLWPLYYQGQGTATAPSKTAPLFLNPRLTVNRAEMATVLVALLKGKKMF